MSTTASSDTLVPPFDSAQFAHDSESTLRAARTPPPAGELTLDRVRALFANGDYEEALEAAEAMLCAVPLHVDARDWTTKCRAALELVYMANIGSLAGVPMLAVTPRETRGFAMDHAAGFLLAQVDGRTDVESLLDLSSMPRHAALRILSSFVARGIVAFR